VTRPLRLETTRLVLRPLASADEPAFHAINADPDVRRYLFDDRLLSPDDSAAMLARSRTLLERDGLGLFGIALRGDATLVGWAGYLLSHEPPQLEIAYALLPSHWGRGIAVEACRAVMTWGARHAGLREFQASTDVPNHPSIRVLEKLGFRETHRAGALVHFALDARRLDRSNVVYVATE
jgi:ribosomal-protein-alanine N-acetyltransferase